MALSATFAHAQIVPADIAAKKLAEATPAAPGDPSGISVQERTIAY